VRLAPDAQASRMLLVHIDRRHHHNTGAIVFVCSSDPHTTEGTSFSLPSLKPPSPYLSALSLLYTSKTEYRRRQQGDGSSRPGLFENRALCRRVGEDSGEAVLHNHTRNSRRHFLVSSFVNCFFASLSLSQIHITTTISVFHRIHRSPFIVQQRQSRSNGPHVIIRN
jgi:hypothetical protein